MVEKIRRYYRKKCLKNTLQTRNREIKFCSLKNAKYVGILYEIGDESTYIWLSKFVNMLLSEGKTLRIVGYHNNKYVPYFCIPQLKYDFFCNKETNWFGKPNANFVQEVIDEPFDILLDLTLEDSFPLNYFTATSNAHFKIGRNTAGKINYLDLMIELEENHAISDLMYFINDYTDKLDGK